MIKFLQQKLSKLSRFQNQNGVALVVYIFVMAAMAALAMAALQMTNLGLQSSESHKKGKEAFYSAEVGLDLAVNAIVKEFEDQNELGITLGGGMYWNGTGGGHLYCEQYFDDDYIDFYEPTYLSSFEMNAMPWENYGGGEIGLQDIYAYDAEGNTVWSTTVDLQNYTNWADWLLVPVETGAVSTLHFIAPGNDPWNNGFWPSIDNMMINENAASLWLSTDIESGIVLSGSSQVIEVTFDATDLLGGEYFADIVITSNDPDEGEVIVSVSLNATGAPNMSVDPGELNFGEVFVDYIYTETLTIANVGTDLLEISDIRCDNGYFDIDATSFSLEPGEDFALAVTFSPTEAGLQEGILTIFSNDINEPEMYISLSGMASSAAPSIQSIVDVPDDQGGRVYISFLRSLI